MFRIKEDCHNLDLPKNYETAFKKIKCDLRHGDRISWYYKEDLDFYNEENENPRKFAPFSGFAVCLDGCQIRDKNAYLEPEECVIIIDTYPIEKDYPECEWIALNRLLNDDNLIEIFQQKTERQTTV